MSGVTELVVAVGGLVTALTGLLGMVVQLRKTQAEQAKQAAELAELKAAQRELAPVAVADIHRKRRRKHHD